MRTERLKYTSSFKIFVSSMIVAAVTVVVLLSPFAIKPAESASLTHVTAHAIEKSGNEVKAFESAKRDAMYRFLSHMIPPTQNPKSDFVRLLERYDDFVVNAKLYKQEKLPDGSLLVIIDAEIDRGYVEDEFRNGVNKKQEHRRNEEMRAAFIVRAIPYPGIEYNGSFEDIIANAFDSNFQKLGFYTDDPDDMHIALENYRNYSFDAYKRNMIASLDTMGITISYAIIGEIAVKDIWQDSTGAYCKAKTNIIAVDAINNKRILASFADEYIGRGVNLPDAEFAVFRKAAMDISEKIARATLDDWNKHIR